MVRRPGANWLVWCNDHIISLYRLSIRLYLVCHYTYIPIRWFNNNQYLCMCIYVHVCFVQIRCFEEFFPFLPIKRLIFIELAHAQTTYTYYIYIIFPKLLFTMAFYGNISTDLRIRAATVHTRTLSRGLKIRRKMFRVLNNVYYMIT